MLLHIFSSSYNTMPFKVNITLGLLVLFSGLFVVGGHSASALTREIIFPVLGPVSHHNDYGAPRSGHSHIGNDMIGKKMQPLLAAVTGTARQVAFPQPSYGWYLSIEDAEGYTYVYIHINNDTPGTDDNKGGGNYAYAPGVDRRWPVVAGQVVAYMGDSGNAESARPHLHFEIHDPNGDPFNPFPSLQAATKLTRAVPTPALPSELLPYNQFKVGSNIATGDIVPELPGDEIVVGAAAGSSPQIRVLTSDGKVAGNFFLPQTRFTGGVDVAVGDVNGDGVNEIITGLGVGGEPLIQILDRNGTVLSQFLAYGKSFKGGARVSSADLDGDGLDEIITGAGRGGGPDVRVYNSSGVLYASFYAYAPRFRGGVDVAGISQTAANPGRIVTAPAAGGGPDIRVYGMFGEFQASFYSDDPAFRGGLRVAAAWDETAGQSVIFTVPMSGARGDIRQLTLDGQILNLENIFERWWTGGFDVAVADRIIYTSSAFNNRRGSIMKTSWSSGSSRFSWNDFFGLSN